MSEQTKTETGVPAELKGIVEIVYLDKVNCTLTVKNGFLGLRAVLDKPQDLFSAEPEKDKKENPEKSGGENKDAAEPNETTVDKKDASAEKKDAAVDKILPDGRIEKTVERIFLSRAFPFDMPFEYISVLDKDKKEIGFIRSLDDFDEPERGLLLHELEAKYYTPIIKRILTVKERYGFSYWKTECDFGEKIFTLQDTFRSIIKSSNDDGSERIFILDVDGNRYEIPNVEELDRLSYKKIELYL